MGESGGWVRYVASFGQRPRAYQELAPLLSPLLASLPSQMFAVGDRRRREVEAELMIMVAIAQVEEEEQDEARPYNRVCPYWKRPRSYKPLYPNCLASLDPQAYNIEFHVPRAVYD
ncbi:hypothetical protein QJQ45_026837 [Haematococcus lacustris]|nr:hypothetical protein QJQ45_026837 [Haematococcus lacustris]